MYAFTTSYLLMARLAELLELLVPILETIASEAASLGFEVNWQKTKVQALGCREDMNAPMEKWTKSTFYSATVNEVSNGKMD